MLHPRVMFDIVRTDVSLSEWDSLLFTVHWPVTTCLIWKEGKPGHTCILPENHVWTIHGILAGRIRTAKRDLSFVTGHGSSILINSELFGRNYSKFGQTSMETIPKILCGSTNGKSMALVLHLIPNLDLNNSILTREFNGLVVHLFLSIQTSS